MSYRYIFLLIIAVLCWNCAQQGSPTGGPRDEDPPRVLESEPPNYSTRFLAKKILITFDEFIVLDNVNQELIVSPPMEEKPEVKLRKKTLIIQFEEALKDSTTYTFNFGSSIKDLHEGNKLLNYEYVFSTGDVLDSLSVRGTLKYAHDLSEPEAPMSIMLYEDLRDSVPLIDIPLYVGRSDDSGVFSVNNLRPDTFKVFVLKDGNNNLLFDLPSEEIAFLDSSLIVNAEFARKLLGDIVAPSDTSILVSDSLKAPMDSLVVASDSITNIGSDLNAIYIDMLLFTEETDIQYLSNYARDQPRKIEMVFARPLTDSFYYRPIRLQSQEPLEMLEYFSTERDSLTLWIRDSTFYKKDSIFLEINFTIRDTADQSVTQIDTLLFSYREKSTRKKKDESEEEEPEILEISTIRKGGEMDLNRMLAFDLDFPLNEINDSLIFLFHIPDTIEVAQPFSITPDTLLLNRGWMSVDWKSAAQYRLIFYPGAITSIYPIEHDTLDISFKTRDSEYYGKILLTLEKVSDRTLVQLISKDKVIREQVVEKSGEIIFGFLVPGDYNIKVIHDLNRNGKWDTGNYMEKRQPEGVEILPVAITVRSNWDHDVTMTLEK